jgi:hypothetical protein
VSEIGIRVMANLPPPTWVSLSSGPVANNALRENVIDPIYNLVNPLMTTLSQIYTLVQAALDFASSFLVDFLNPIKVIVDEILKIIEAVIQDFKNTGFYITWDSAFRKSLDSEGLAASVAPFRGGYSRIRNELVQKLSDATDNSRPNFSTSSSVLSLTAVVGIEGESGYRQAKAVLNQILNLFSVAKPLGSFPPPLAPKVFLAGKRSLPFVIPPERVSESLQPTGIIVNWSLPQAKSIPALQGLDLPPASFLIHVSTRQTPYIFALEKQSPLSTGDSKKDTLIVPLLYNNTPIPATTTWLPLISNLGDFILEPNTPPTPNKHKLVAIPRIGAAPSEIVSVEKLKVEGATFYYDTSAIGVLSTGSEYRVYIPYSDLPSERYSQDGNEGGLREYYVSVSSHESTLEGVEDGGKLTPNSNISGDIYLKIDGDKGVLVPVDDKSFGYVPKTSPSVGCALPQNTDLYRGLSNAFTLFLMAERCYGQHMASLIGVAPDTIDLIYSYFDARPVYESALYSERKEDAFRSDLKDYVDNAVTKFVARGGAYTPTLKAKLEAFMAVMPPQNGIYAQLSQKKEAIGVKRLGWVPSYDFLNENGDYDSANTYKIAFNDRKIPQSFIAPSEVVRSGLYRQALLLPRWYRAPSYITATAITNFVDLYPPSVLLKAFEVLGALPEKKRHIGAGNWVFLRLFTDGFTSIDQFLDLIRGFMKDISDGLKGAIDAVKKYIELLKQRIDTLYQFILKIKAILDAILSIRLPSGNVSYLMTVSSGNKGVIDALSSSANQPRSGETELSTYTMLVFGGLPTIVTQFLLSLVDSQNTVDSLFNPQEQINDYLGINQGGG